MINAFYFLHHKILLSKQKCVGFYGFKGYTIHRYRPMLIIIFIGIGPISKIGSIGTTVVIVAVCVSLIFTQCPKCWGKIKNIFDIWKYRLSVHPSWIE